MIRVLDEEYKKDNGKYLEVKFHHLDGAYSYCTDENGSAINLAAWTPVEIIK
jgi:hypothetical protein